MKVKAIKTSVFKPKEDLKEFIRTHIPSLEEGSVVVIASKIVSYSQDRFVEKVTGDKSEKYELVKKEADFYTDPNSSKYNLMFTITHNTLAVNAGVDESNANGRYLLWPTQMQKVVNELWQWLREEYMVERVGVMLTDSKTTPMRWGAVGTCIASCGFEVLRSYIGTEDIFGYIMKMEQTNVAEGIAAAAVLEMGEGAERQPLAVVSEVGEINFMDRVPSEQELEGLKIAKEDDFFEPMLKKVEWKKGR